MTIRNCEITGYGTTLPERTVHFDDQQRYRVSDHETQLGLLSDAGRKAVELAGLELREIDCFVGASAAGIQPIPCTAALVMERLAPQADAAAFDINSTCTSFITAIDQLSYAVHDGRYRNVLITAGDVGTRFLNPSQRESYELFSDAAAAIVLSQTNDSSRGVIASKIKTWPQHAHDTEIRGGLSALPPYEYGQHDPSHYQFDMNGKAVLLAAAKLLRPFFRDFYQQAGLTPDDIDLVIPHQASRALDLIMRQLGIPKERYVDIVSEYGNMVSASVPYALCKSLGEHAIGAGDRIMLCGTAAGLTANALVMQL